DYYRSLGCKQLIYANNWKTADATLLFDAERYTNTSCEIIAINRYYDPGHVGPNAGWRIDPGDCYEGKSVLFRPHQLPVNIKQVVGHPTLVTESGWNLPHKYQAEGPFLVAAFMSLTGVDSYYWFSPTSPAYDPNPYFTWANLPGGQHPMDRWTISTPGQLAMFPANALIFRKGLISEGKTMVHEVRTPTSFFSRQMPLISEENSFDPNRDNYSNINPAKDTPVSPLAHLTGRIEVVYDTVASGSVVSPAIEADIDYHKKIIKASNGQIEWDYKNGICVLNAPSAKGVCGFVKSKQSFDLNDIIIESSNDYAVVNVVAMDDQPISESSKILIQIGTVYRPTAWAEVATSFDLNGTMVSGFKIENTGKMPWKCANTQVTVKIKNKGLNLARLLDAAGYAKSTIDIVDEGEHVKIELPATAMYVVLENTTTPVEKSSGLNLKNHHLFDNYPNPFNTATMIHYFLAQPGFVSIDVYNTIGQRVDNLISAHQIPGDYQILWDTANKPIASGAYVCRMKVGDYEAKKRMLLLK
ncbi:MAG: T9SS type A sorting domain-containing protein, partial [candidate division KSB1 bacterium]|nr:T9SS type A sorting domain-containing protein [candidate division KSB1 bacterium]